MKATALVEDIDRYIGSRPDHVREKLGELRQIIRSAAPKAEEVISYRMPAFKLNGILVYFAACKNHIGFYPTGSGITAFEKELTVYNYSKGAIQFPLDKPLPIGLIKRIVKFRLRLDAEVINRNKLPKK